MKTWKLTVKMDFEDETRYAVLEQMMKEAGKQMLATAMILKDRREVRITLEGGDAFNPVEKIDIMSELVTSEGN